MHFAPPLISGYHRITESGVMQMLSPILRFLLVVLGTAGYLGLAVLGWGGFAAFFSHSALAGVAVIQCVFAITALFAGGNLSAGVKEDRGNRWVIAALVVPGLIQAYLPAWTDRHDILCIDGDTVRWIGVLLFSAGGVVRLWPVFVLGNRFSGLVAIQEGHTLVTTGIYSRIRNPSYLGLLVGALGWSLAFRSWAGVFLTALMVPPLVVRMRSEERLLRAEFGGKYEAYRARTARLVPGVY
jgi:protein-S-isoprenylcysteine O-methyltransferase Ste14